MECVNQHVQKKKKKKIFSPKDTYHGFCGYLNGLF